MRKKIGAALAAATLAAVSGGGVALAGPAASNSQAVTCANGTVTAPQRLWPPNHKLRNVPLSFNTTETDGDTLTLTVNSITSSEDGLEKGATANHGPDYTDTTVPPTDTGTEANGTTATAADPASVTIQLRAERMGTDRAGRTYTVNVTCDDAGDVSGNPDSTATVDVLITVPHDRGHH